MFEADDLVEFIKTHDTTAARILNKNRKPRRGDLVGVRLNLNVLRNTGVPVQTLHSAKSATSYKKNKGFFRGEVVGYARTVWLENGYFNVDQATRNDIATGVANKSAMASIDGTILGYKDEIPEGGLEVRFNPRDVHLFVDINNNAVHYAQYIVVSGHRAYAFGRIVYHSDNSAPVKAGPAPSAALLVGHEIMVPIDTKFTDMVNLH